VIVGNGKTKKEISINQALVCNASKFFKAACKPEWGHGEKNTVTLKEEDPVIFAIFIAWLITGKIENSAELVEITATDKNEWKSCFQKQSFQLGKCYVLGDYLQAPSFQNAVMDQLVYQSSVFGKECNAVLPGDSESVKIAWAQTSTGSALRRFIIDNVYKNASTDEFSGLYTLPLPHIQDYFVDLAVHGMDNKGKTAINPWVKDRCEYHVHPGKPEGCSCTKK
jgi:hypothetical protein